MQNELILPKCSKNESLKNIKCLNSCIRVKLITIIIQNASKTSLIAYKYIIM